MAKCGQRGRITKTNRLSDDVSDLYCQCTDAECGHSWVVTLSFAHTLSPSAKTTNQLVLSDGFADARGRQLVLKGLRADVTAPLLAAFRIGDPFWEPSKSF
ncbi:ogr/Delta-like zinc finger family protein [Aeromonas hydrophila]|uniref:Ogr/Delta-like zinc finger family protein n=1 Tax=Aeromonas hydrophila TaxID=644 RepID=A0A926IY82_AERHY|nr:ogr/Delta-like zinc finger family protein [Aeromonas hydrophila]